MKRLFTTLALATLAALSPTCLHAQATALIVSGRATIVLDPGLIQQFTGLGITVTNLSKAPMQNATNVLPAIQGAIDLDTAVNEVIYGGGYQLIAGNTTIQLRMLTLDLVGPSAVFSALVVENNTLIGREALFSISAQGPPTLPIVPNHGTISHKGLTLSFEQPFVDLINAAVGNSGLNTTAQIGTLDLFSVLAPLSGGTWPNPHQ